MVLSEYLIKSKTKELFTDKLMISELYALQPRRKKVFSSFLTLFEDLLSKFFSF